MANGCRHPSGTPIRNKPTRLWRCNYCGEIIEDDLKWLKDLWIPLPPEINLLIEGERENGR